MIRRPLNPVAVVLLALSLLLAHVPVVALAGEGPGALVQVATVDAAPSAGCCGGCGPGAEAAPDDAPRDTGAPCCPSGCSHCPLPCCSSPLAPARPEARAILDQAAAPRVEPLLPSFSSTPPDGVFHPPRR